MDGGLPGRLLPRGGGVDCVHQPGGGRGSARHERDKGVKFETFIIKHFFIWETVVEENEF